MNRILFYRPLYRGFVSNTRGSLSCLGGSRPNIFQKRLPLVNINTVRFKSGKKKTQLSSLVRALPVTPEKDPDSINVGAELTGSLGKKALLALLDQFQSKEEVYIIAAENGLDRKLFRQVYISFRAFCCTSKSLPTDLHVVLSDILQGSGHVTDILPYFLQHARHMYPHLDCMDDLCKISDLRLPANWYPDARNIHRKVIYHAGPTNSGKTYQALQKLFAAKTGVYCGPLRMLASEVYQKTNAEGVPCDLVTGEERIFVNEDEEPASHVSCTVEMVSVSTPYDVAVIDEVQMLRDRQRGWAWTRSLMGVCAREVHLCGDASAIDFVRDLCLDTGDDFEVRRYKRLTKLKVMNQPVESFSNVKPGDCIVCFSKSDIYSVSRQLEKIGINVAVIYGTLPASTKIAQAQKFNDQDDSCKVLVATDAVGMGLNLNIKRIVFFSLVKPTINEDGEKEISVISASQALQIAGRAGRYGTAHEEGLVTTFASNDLNLLSSLLKTAIDPVEQAGLNPTAEHVELFAFHLPKASLSNIIVTLFSYFLTEISTSAKEDIFVNVCQLDKDKYFMCNLDDFKFLAQMIEHVPLPLRIRYVFCCAPIPRRHAFVCSLFLKFARQFSRNEPVTFSWLCVQLDWPFTVPKFMTELVHLEGAYDVLDNYLWLSYRFGDMFPDVAQVRDMQNELDYIIRQGVANITMLLKNSEKSPSTPDNEDDFEMKTRKKDKKNKSQRELPK